MNCEIHGDIPPPLGQFCVKLVHGQEMWTVEAYGVFNREPATVIHHRSAGRRVLIIKRVESDLFIHGHGVRIFQFVRCVFFIFEAGRRLNDQIHQFEHQVCQSGTEQIVLLLLLLMLLPLLLLLLLLLLLANVVHAHIGMLGRHRGAVVCCKRRSFSINVRMYEAIQKFAFREQSALYNQYQRTLILWSMGIHGRPLGEPLDQNLDTLQGLDPSNL